MRAGSPRTVQMAIQRPSDPSLRTLERTLRITFAVLSQLRAFALTVPYSGNMLPWDSTWLASHHPGLG